MEKKKMTSPMLPESEPRAGFRILANGEVEMMTETETYALVMRAIREGMRRTGWPPLKRTVH
ncbi:hypothetical protein QCM80_02480 [Bradyrhizobium sp. SSUT112]|uniref:hypothetical protein n=1 Tax=Bradyrhizobium sp. SSUT112 TaxID=3040604 RepID=UPI00244CB2F1|nr:hypothetical protein [Bradyrhizobium sp. SSUT112]MDH2349550.1 hypothetical protein [Bradyrhizobium sp. SSUT112]